MSELLEAAQQRMERAAELIERFDHGLDALKASGEYQRIVDRYVE